MKSINDKLVDIQGRLKAPKNQRNSFGNYNYRSCEDILEAVKPLLTKHNLRLNLNDEVIQLGELYYIDSYATLADGDKSISVKAQAGINLNKKGMDIAQSFGSSSSYARKYALNGLFLIDDTKDADATNNHNVGTTEPQVESSDKPWLQKGTKQFDNAKKAMLSGNYTLTNIREKYKVSKEVASLLQK
jgi:hypothetical protein|tara:strand:+ start:1740 stop:2303 length:564 start_codon:yes stop_codon:yes gene_type:complete